MRFLAAVYKWKERERGESQRERRIINDLIERDFTGTGPKVAKVFAIIGLILSKFVLLLLLFSLLSYITDKHISIHLRICRICLPATVFDAL